MRAKLAAMFAVLQSKTVKNLRSRVGPYLPKVLYAYLIWFALLGGYHTAKITSEADDGVIDLKSGMSVPYNITIDAGKRVEKFVLDIIQPTEE